MNSDRRERMTRSLGRSTIWYSECCLGVSVFQANSSISVGEWKRNLSLSSLPPLPLSPRNSTLLAINFWEPRGAGREEAAALGLQVTSGLCPRRVRVVTL